MTRAAYTNRHGTKMTVADDDVAQPVAPQKPARVKPVRRRRRWNMPKIRLSKRVIVALASIIAVLALIGIVTSDSVKREYERQEAAMKRAVGDAGKLSPSQDASASSVGQSLIDILKRTPSDCKVSGIAIESWYGPARTARQNCEQTAKDYRALQVILGDFIEISQYLESVKAAMGPALDTKDEGYAIIGDYMTAWKQAKDGLGTISVPDNLKADHTKLVGNIDHVAMLWQQLSDASVAQNTVNFKTAEADLKKAYDDFRTSFDGVKTKVTVTQSEILRLQTALQD